MDRVFINVDTRPQAQKESEAVEARKPRRSPDTYRKLFLIDGHAMVHRAYHAPMLDLSADCPNGPGCDLRCLSCAGTGREPTKATWGFVRALLRLCREQRPDYLLMAMDSPREKLHRRKLYPGYKANRPEGEWELKAQIRRITQIVKALGVPVARVVGYEADDIIATVTDAAKGISDLETVVVTRDKDLAQLIGERVRLYDAMQEEYLDGRWVKERYGVAPHQMRDYLALVGDTGDNVPGVKGIGDKGGAEFLGKYELVDAFFKQLEKWPEMELGRCEKALTAHREEYLLSRALVSLDREVPLEGFNFAKMRFRGLDTKAASPLFRQLNFKRWDEASK